MLLKNITSISPNDIWSVKTLELTLLDIPDMVKRSLITDEIISIENASKPSFPLSTVRLVLSVRRYGVLQEGGFSCEHTYYGNKRHTDIHEKYEKFSAPT